MLRGFHSPSTCLPHKTTTPATPPLSPLEGVRDCVLSGTVAGSSTQCRDNRRIPSLIIASGWSCRLVMLPFTKRANKALPSANQPTQPLHACLLLADRGLGVVEVIDRCMGCVGGLNQILLIYHTHMHTRGCTIGRWELYCITCAHQR